MNNIYYTALFINGKESLLKIFSPKHKNIVAHHMTLKFKPDNLTGVEVGKFLDLKKVPTHNLVSHR